MQNKKINQAVILSAGLGTRLRPITDKMPKVMIPIHEKPLLYRNIEQFKKFGVREFFINLHYFSDVIVDYFKNGSGLGIKINYFFEPVLLGTAGGLKNFENQLDEEFFLIYGDILSLVNYDKLHSFFKDKKSAIGVQRLASGFREDADLVTIDKGGKFLRIYPKPHIAPRENSYTMRGIFILNKRILSFIPKNSYFEIGRDLLPKVLEVGEDFYGYECLDYSKGIDTISKYKEVEEYYKKL